MISGGHLEFAEGFVPSDFNLAKALLQDELGVGDAVCHDPDIITQSHFIDFY
jgi:hypothetical protein